MDDLFTWINDLAPALNTAPFRHVDCPRCGAWVAIVCYADWNDPTGRERAIAGLARATGLPTYFITVAGPDDFTPVVRALYPPGSAQIWTTEQFSTTLTQLAAQHPCPS
jgi:hypothetical protein